MYSRILLVLTSCLGLIAPTFCQISEWGYRGQSVTCVKNRILTNHLVEVTSGVPSRLKCVARCFSVPSCQSINYATGTKECHLSTVQGRVSAAGEYQESQEFEYCGPGPDEEWEKTPKHLGSLSDTRTTSLPATTKPSTEEAQTTVPSETTTMPITSTRATTTTPTRKATTSPSTSATTTITTSDATTLPSTSATTTITTSDATTLPSTSATTTITTSDATTLPSTPATTTITTSDATTLPSTPATTTITTSDATTLPSTPATTTITTSDATTLPSTPATTTITTSDATTLPSTPATTTITTSDATTLPSTSATTTITTSDATTLPSTPATTTSDATTEVPTTTELIAADCETLAKHGRQSGVHVIYTTQAGRSNAMKVYCDINGDDGWIVIQRREDGTVDFNRNWVTYKNGFGDLESEFWLGNSNIKTLTSSGTWRLRIDLLDWEGGTSWAEYDSFYLTGTKYELVIGSYSGNADDALSYHSGSDFSTVDSDNDDGYRTSCAASYQSGWWFKYCLKSNLNGVYYQTNPVGFNQGLQWDGWKNDYYSLKGSVMKIRKV